jgi:hypothetical protein
MDKATYDLVIEILGSLLRLLGMLAFGLGAGWFLLEFFRKAQQAWQLQIAIFLGFVGLAIAAVFFLTPAALGAFGISFGVAMLVWGLPKKKKEEEKK